jgi:hypothetical protein
MNNPLTHGSFKLKSKPFPLSIVVCMIIAVLVSACQPATGPSTMPAGAMSVKTLPATQVPPATAESTRVPPKLPDGLQSAQLNPLDAPRAYIKDACRYLRARWDARNAVPGTVVMIVMLNSINKGIVPESSDAITVRDFARMMEELHKQQFQAIDTGQLAGFLEDNAMIPPRSVVLLQDGRRFAENFNKHFRPYWEMWNWPVVNAWEALADTTETLWDENVALENEGWVDHQVYGFPVTSDIDNFSDQNLMIEFQKPRTAFRERFEKDPIAIVWPGGFGIHSAQIARQTGYRLGFTHNARGPVMFNWVPLADKTDNLRPSYTPEAAVNDPLMTLPRYWPYQVHDALDSVRVIGNEAAAYAEQNKAVELEYYDIVCAPTYGAIPGLAP